MTPASDSLVIPPIDFQTWLITIGAFQGIPVGIALVFCIFMRWARRRLAKGPADFCYKYEGRTLWLTFLFTLIGVGLGFGTLIYLHTGVGPFFLSAAICFYSTLVLQPILTILRAIINKKWLAAALFTLPPALAVDMLFIEPNRLEVLRGELYVPTLPPGCIIKIAHFSDVQTVNMAGRELEALRAANEFNSDFAVITGDLTATGIWDPIVQQFRAWLSQLKTKHGVFVVNGDSDPDFDYLVNLIGNLNYLKDAGKEITVNGARLWLAGVDNLRRPPNPIYSLRNAPAGATRIVLSHNPDRFFYDGDWRAEVGLSGHTHGGQIQIPGFGALITFTKLGRRYADGIFDKSKFDPDIPFKVDAFTVCAGLGMEGAFAPRVRFWRGPQIILLTLKGPAQN